MAAPTTPVATLIYDGECAMCRASALWIMRRAMDGGALEILPCRSAPRRIVVAVTPADFDVASLAERLPPGVSRVGERLAVDDEPHVPAVAHEVNGPHVGGDRRRAVRGARGRRRRQRDGEREGRDYLIPGMPHEIFIRWRAIQA